MKKISTSAKQKYYKQTVKEKQAVSVSYDYEWREFSKEYRVSNPFCVECLKLGNYNAKNTHVDHIVPLEKAPERKYDDSNLQTLCRSCHGKKTFKEKLEKKGED